MPPMRLLCVYASSESPRGVTPALRLGVLDRVLSLLLSVVDGLLRLVLRVLDVLLVDAVLLERLVDLALDVVGLLLGVVNGLVDGVRDVFLVVAATGPAGSGQSDREGRGDGSGPALLAG